MSAPTQKQEILSMLMAGDRVTPIDALREVGCFRLAARIGELRDDGHDIKTEMISRENQWGRKIQFAEYRIEKAGSAEQMELI